MTYIYIVCINSKLEYFFDELDNALSFIATSINSEVNFNSYTIYQKEVEE